MIQNGSKGIFTHFRTQRHRLPRFSGVRPASVFGVPLRRPVNTVNEREIGAAAVAAYARSLTEQRVAAASIKRSREKERFDRIALKRKKQLEPQ